jgi:hypothetical protein
VDDRQRRALRLGREPAVEGLSEQWVDDGVQALLGKAIPVFLCLPDVEVAQAPLGPLDSKVDDEPLRRVIAETIGDPLVETSPRTVIWPTDSGTDLGRSGRPMASANMGLS